MLPIRRGVSRSLEELADFHKLEGTVLSKHFTASLDRSARDDQQQTSFLEHAAVLGRGQARVRVFPAVQRIESGLVYDSVKLSVVEGHLPRVGGQESGPQLVVLLPRLLLLLNGRGCHVNGRDTGVAMPSQIATERRSPAAGL
eukprot:scaffold770_cov255-Pinguiococcus_pyrenoidosus.AAC.47